MPTAPVPLVTWVSPIEIAFSPTAVLSLPIAIPCEDVISLPSPKAILVNALPLIIFSLPIAILVVEPAPIIDLVPETNEPSAYVSEESPWAYDAVPLAMVFLPNAVE